MQMPADYNSVERQTEFGSGYKKLPASGYVCRIKSVQDTMSYSGKPMLKIALDIEEGEFKGYFMDRFELAKKYRSDAKWPCVGIVMQKNDDGSTNGGFKNFVQCVEESNPGWKPAWGDGFEEHFRRCVVGCVFREEEYELNGEVRSNVKPDFAHFKSATDIRNGNFDVPEKKALEKKNNNNTTFVSPGNAPEQDDEIPEGFAMIDEADIPF